MPTRTLCSANTRDALRWSDAVTFWTYEDPENVLVVATHGTITVTWQPPHDGAEPWYRVAISDASGPVGYPISRLTDDVMWTFDGLQPSTTSAVKLTYYGSRIGTAGATISTASFAAGARSPAPAVGPRAIIGDGRQPLFDWPMMPGPSIPITFDPWIWRGSGEGRFHAGLDLGSPVATPVYAAADGMQVLVNRKAPHRYTLYCPRRPGGVTLPLYKQIRIDVPVSEIEEGGQLICNYIVSPASGRTALIFHGSDGHGPEVTRYSHLASFPASITAAIDASPDRAVLVDRADLIAGSGASGYGSERFYDPHLHFETRYLGGTVS